MRLAHFEAFAPRCPVCMASARASGEARLPERLVIAQVAARTEDTIVAGILHCPGCGHEYPVLDGVPVIVPQLRQVLVERGLEMMLRDDLDAGLESLLGDAIGPDSWLDAIRQMQSSYGWDGYGDLDPDEAPPAGPGAPAPGAARRCLARLLALADAPEDAQAQANAEHQSSRIGVDATRLLDLGCAAGRTSFDLACAHPGALVLGVDLQLGLLRLAAGAAAGRVSYPRRRIGLVYDRRRFDVAIAGAERVDFWACDARALPFAPGSAGRCAALNLLDCVPDPRLLLDSLAAATAPGGDVLLATPYDWSARATPPEAWLGGHSQRAGHGGAGEAFLHALLDGSAHAVAGLRCRAEDADWPWHTRLHDRSTVRYRTHLLALRRG